MADYLEYLQTEGIAGWANIANMRASAQAQLIQNAKNNSAPIVSGGGIRSSSYTGPLTNLPAMKGKIAPVKAGVTQNWGASRIKYAAGRHTGMDFGAPTGARVGSAASGIVIRTGREGAYGNAIHVRHKDGTTALYAHLSGINVKPGQRVKAGQQIGRVGSTGRSFGSHLHFEIRKADKYGADINPRRWYSTR